MATQRTQGQDGRGTPGRTGEQLEGTTDDGIEVSASLDDDDGALSADSDSEDSEEEGSSGLRGGSGNFANDPERASEAGRKGGRN